MSSEEFHVEIYAHDDKALEKYSETVNKYLSSFIATGQPYWVAVHGGDVIGAVMDAVEPVHLIEPVGTPMSLLGIFDYGAPLHALRELTLEGLRIAKENEAAYSFIDVPAEHEELIDYFLEIGYKEIAHSLRMSRALDEEFVNVGDLRFEKVKREGLNDFLSTVKEFMSGSPDVMLNIVLDNFTEFPDEFLDRWYESELLYRVYDGDDLVGILDLSPNKTGNLSNIGVSPNHRGKGYGRMMMNFAMMTLREAGDERTMLRVHIDNTRAIHLYESLGFERHKEYRALIWRE